MLITETVERECCEPRDLQKYKGLLGDEHEDLYFCAFCGELWQLQIYTPAPGEKDTRFTRFFAGTGPEQALLHLATHGGALVCMESCSRAEMDRDYRDDRFFTFGAFAFFRRDAEWLNRVSGLEDKRCLQCHVG